METNWYGDAAVSSQLVFQDPATTTMEGIFLFNLHLLFLIISIVLFVGWMLLSVTTNFIEIYNSKIAKFTHSNTIEIVWTSIPAIILLMFSLPSFSLLYSLDEISEPEITLKIIGHQWYWTYEISDYNTCSTTKKIKYSSYIMSDDSLKEETVMGYFRNLETNKRILLPTNTHIRLLVTSADVLHSWTIPSLGVKVDACPGRLNQANLFIKRIGLFYGQCSEICGVNHAFMPISLITFPSLQYHHFVLSHLNSETKSKSKSKTKSKSKVKKVKNAVSKAYSSVG